MTKKEKEIKKAIKQADKIVRRAFLKHSVFIEGYESANKAGQKLAKHFKVNEDIILLGTILMDIKLGEALKLGKPEEHIKMSYEAAKKFLDKFDILQSDKLNFGTFYIDYLRLAKV